MAYISRCHFNPIKLTIVNSVAYGVPSIVSDIEVNKELSDDTVMFFNSSSYEDLAEKMQTLFFAERKFYTKEELVSKNQASLREMGTKILSLIN